MGAARAGFRVLLEDVLPGNLHHAREAIREQLDAAALPAVDFVATIEDAVREADLAIDCVPDELESKLEILWLIDRMAPPRTVIATPTTTQSIADLASCTNRPEKCVAIAVAPAELTAGAGPEITLRAGPLASEDAIELVREFWERLGLRPVVERSAE
jgi:3-hydroxybutyryl-CoA dehydrogenase